MADVQDPPEKAPGKGFADLLLGNFASDAHVAILERVVRELEEQAYKAVENLRAVNQILQKLKDDQAADLREAMWIAEREAQRPS